MLAVLDQSTAKVLLCTDEPHNTTEETDMKTRRRSLSVLNVGAERRGGQPVSRRLMPALAAMVLLLLTGTGTLLYWQHRQQMDRDSTNVAADVSRDLSVALTQQTADLAAAAQTIAAELPVQEALREKDDRRLLAFGQPVFEALRLKNHISHFYFFDPNRVCLLRLHKPDKKGDRIERFTALEAERTGKPASGIELGTMGNLTLRMVQPVYAGGALVGYVEVGRRSRTLFKKCTRGRACSWPCLSARSS